MPFNNGQLPSFKSILNNLIDSLNKFLLIILLILIILTIFIRTFIFDFLKIAILALIIFRITSKNKYQRNKENQKFLKIRNLVLKPFSNIIRNFKDRKEYVYKKCSKCKTTLKLPLPKNRGVQHAKCPNCSARVTLFTFRKKPEEKIKVEVIKKKSS